MTRHRTRTRTTRDACHRSDAARTASAALRRGQRATTATTEALHTPCDGQLSIFDALDVSEEDQR